MAKNKKLYINCIFLTTTILYFGVVCPSEVYSYSDFLDKSPSSPQARSSFQGKQEIDDANTIVVTGSHIRGIISAGSSVDVITNQQIVESGYATLHHYMQTYVQNFSGGIGEDTIDVQSQGNFTEASGINLRGLGNSATLMLVNGRRVAIAGADASFSDASLIPVTAIERVEILTDGGSAIYGTDAVAGVVNIVLRKDFDGAETRARIGSVTKGGLQEYLFGQTFGQTWENGHSIISYEYLRREALFASERSFTSSLDHRASGGTDNRGFYSNPGNILNPNTFQPEFGIPLGQNGVNLDPAQLNHGIINLSSLSSIGTILPSQRRHSAYIYAEHDIERDISFFLEGRFSSRKTRSKSAGLSQFLVVPSSNAFFVDPYGNSDFIYVTYDITPDLGLNVSNSKVNDYNATLGSNVSLGADYEVRIYGAAAHQSAVLRDENRVNDAALSGALADANPETAFNPFGDGSNTNPSTLEAIRGQLLTNTKSTMLTANIIFDGPLFQLPAGELKFAVGADYQDIKFSEYNRGSAIPSPQKFSVDREIGAVFGELSVPILPPYSAERDVGRLDLSLAARYDHYSDVGGTTNPKIGARWDALLGLSLRANWGTSFRAPNLTHLNGIQNFSSSAVIPNPQNPSEMVQILYSSGANQDLKNQTSDNWGVGFTFETPFIEGFRISFDYFDIKFKDRIGQPGSILWALSRPNEYGHLAILNPSQDDLNRFCSRPYQIEFNTDLCRNPGAVHAIIDNRYQNLSQTHIKGLDATFIVGIPINVNNDITINANSTYILDFTEKASLASEANDNVDTLGYPVDFRARMGINWVYKDWLTTNIFVNYTDSYRDTTNSPFLKVESWLTFDATVSAKFGNNETSLLKNTTISLSIINMFSQDPPFVNGLTYAYDPNNADPLGRFVSINIAKIW